jgi:spore maturation protein CgeB
MGIYERMLRFQVDGVIVVSGSLIHDDTITLMRRIRVPVGVLLTESPYLMESEKHMAARVDCAWTHERSAVMEIASVQSRTSYLPHAWLPGVHDRPSGEEAPAHDVVFVGTGFSERIALLQGVDWGGIDLGLYGNWSMLPSRSKLRKYVRGGLVSNAFAAALYRRSKVGLNLYRESITTRATSPQIDHAESLNPRAYELAASGSFHLSTPRAEVVEKFGPLVPLCKTSDDLTTLLRYWLTHEDERRSVAARLPALVAEDTWIARGGQVLGTMRGLLARAA